MARGQAERLMPLLAELLAEAGAGFGDLAAIGVGIGPGNFTGVRISVAAARGLALARAIPAIGIGRLEAAAHGLPRPVIAVEHALRGGLYLQRFQAPPTDAPGPNPLGAGHAAQGGPELIAAEDLGTAAIAAHGWPLTGSAAGVLACSQAAAMASDAPARAPASPALILPAAMPLAEAIARLADLRRATPQPRPAPLYMRPADAAPSSVLAPPILDPA
jgi:tRNA threonylcarbamoyl adenosine modification protein YeaZ